MERGVLLVHADVTALPLFVAYNLFVLACDLFKERHERFTPAPL